MQRREFLQRSSILAGLAAAGSLSPSSLAHADSPESRSDPLPPFRSIDDVTRLRGIPGALIQFHLRSPETGDAFTLFEAWAKPGMEPARHVHEHEDETMAILEGVVWVRVGDEEFELAAGESLFMPRRVPHEFKIRSEQMHAFLLINPGDFGEFFWDFGMPLASKEIPPLTSEPPSPEVIEKMQQAMASYGITSVS